MLIRIDVLPKEGMLLDLPVEGGHIGDFIGEQRQTVKEALAIVRENRNKRKGYRRG